MSHNEPNAETTPITKEERVILVRELMVTWNVLDHLNEHGAGIDQLALRDAAGGCCRPDGGTCCVNKRPETMMES